MSKSCASHPEGVYIVQKGADVKSRGQFEHTRTYDIPFSKRGVFDLVLRTLAHSIAFPFEVVSCHPSPNPPRADNNGKSEICQQAG